MREGQKGFNGGTGIEHQSDSERGANRASTWAKAHTGGHTTTQVKAQTLRWRAEKPESEEGVDKVHDTGGDDAEDVGTTQGSFGAR
jgi:ferric-dicitrate binding protein FerR (iron transport regulator)